MTKEHERIFKRTESVVDLRTKAAMEAVWNAMPWGLTITLPGGEEATLKQFVAPRQDKEGWGFGFDVAETEGNWHLEFFVRKTGWGGKPVEPMENPDEEEPHDQTR